MFFDKFKRPSIVTKQLVLGQNQHLPLCGKCFKKKGKKSFAQFCSRSEQQETLFSQTFKSAK